MKGSVETTEVVGASAQSGHDGHAAALDSLLDSGLTACSDTERIHAIGISTQNTATTTIPTTNSPITTATTTTQHLTPRFNSPFPLLNRPHRPYPSHAEASAAATALQMAHCASPAVSSSSATAKNSLSLPHPVALSTICLSGSLEDTLQAISLAGFNCVEIYENDLVRFSGQLGEIRELCYDLGLTVSAMKAGDGLVGVESSAKAWRIKERLDDEFSKMDLLGTDLLVVPTSSLESLSWTRAQIVSDLREAADMAEKRGKRIALQHISWATNLNRWDIVWDLVREVDRTSLGLCLDSFHILSHPSLFDTTTTSVPSHGLDAALQNTLAALADIPRHKIFTIYLSDAPYLVEIATREAGLHCRLLPGQGGLNLKGLLDLIVSGSNYTGTLTLETSTEDHKVAAPKRIAMDGRRSILCLLSLVYDPYHAVKIPVRMDIDTQEYGKATPSHSTPPGYVVLPPTGTIYGFEFIEFVVNGAKLETLGRCLELIGFRRVGKHRHKNIFLYRSGKASVLLNSDPAIFGASLFARRGVTIYVVGVRVSDVSTILDRARCLNYPVVPISRQTNPAEFFWAVQAPDETLIVMLQDSDWERDYNFEVFPDISDGIVHIEGASFSVIDHLALALDRVTLDTFCVFYQSMFGMNHHYSREQTDIYSVSKFREFVSCPSSLPWQEDPCPISGGLRFPIGIFENRETTIGNLVHAVGGSTVHHLAFGTNDIFTLAEKIKKTLPHKHTIVPVPAHYYDELGSKYKGLPTEYIMQMKKYDILYDRIDNGEFLTMYTELFEERFFLEICERKGGYARFGLALPEIPPVAREQRTQSMQPVKIPGSEWKEKQNHKILGLRGENSATVVVVGEGEDLVYWLQQTSDVLGCEYKVVECWSDLHQIEEQATPSVVVGINEKSFLHHFVEHWETPLSTVSEASSQTGKEKCGGKRILIYPVRAEAGTASDERLSTICDFEFYYSKLKYNRREYARFLTFALQLTYPHPHDEIVAKDRSYVLTLPFQNIAKVVDMIEILTIGVDAVELRVDMLQEQPDVSRFPSIRYVGEQVMWLRQSTELPIVFTIRTTRPRFNLPLENPDIIYQYLLKALQWGCEYLDVEVQLPEHLRSRLFSRRGMARILSTYCTAATSKYPWMSKESERVYEACNRYADAVRIFGFAETLSDNFELETFRSRVTKVYNVPLPLMAINMGQWGQMSRLLNGFMTPVTHPLMANLALPGQMSVAELNAGHHIIGKLPKRDLYSFRLISRHNLNSLITTGGIPTIFDNYGASFPSRSDSNMSNTTLILAPPANAVFTEKCIKELNLPIKLTNLGVPCEQADNQLQLLLQSPSLGYLTFPIPFPIPSYLPYTTPSARAIGTIDAISEHFSDGQRLLIGDNCLWKAIRKILHRDFSAEAYRGKPGLILSRSESDAAAALYALCTVGVSKIYTIGFGIRRRPGYGSFDIPGGEIEIIRLKSPNELRTKTQPFVVISVLSIERTSSVIPLLGMISEVCEAKHLSRLFAGRVFVEVIPGFGGLAPRTAGSGGVTSGVAQAARRANWPFVYEPVDVQAILITEKLKFMLGQNMSWGFMRMTAQGFY